MKKLSLVAAIAAPVLLTACVSNGGDSEALVKPLSSFPIQDNALKNSVAEEFKKKNFTLNSYQIEIGNKTYKNGNGINLQEFGLGLKTLPVTESMTITGDNKTEYKATGKHTAYLFTQNYSMIGGLEQNEYVVKSLDGRTILKEGEKDELNILVKGQATEKLPETGKFNYNGLAWIEGGKVANLSYDVDFGAKLGSGTIKNTDSSIDIALTEGNIEKRSFENTLDGTRLEGFGIHSAATVGGERGSYTLGFFGPEANEIIGEVDLNKTKSGLHGFFGGTKQAK